MTRKDYELIAEAIDNARHEADWAEPYGHLELKAIDATAVCIADNLAADNPRFDRARFLTACGVEN